MSKKNKIYGLCRKIIIGMEVGTKVIVILLFAIVFAIKIYKIDFSIIQADIITILSFLVSFFAIGLSVIFYFKADEANNRFYHQTYIFIKETSTLLGRIEATFGTKLDGIKSDFDKYWINRDYSGEREDREKDKEIEKQLKEELEASKNKISDLLNETKINEKNKKELINEIEKIKKINNELIQKQVEIKNKISFPKPIAYGFVEYLFKKEKTSKIKKLIDNDNINLLVDKFEDYALNRSEPQRYFIDYLEVSNYEELKAEFLTGYDFIKKLIQKELEENN